MGAITYDCLLLGTTQQRGGEIVKWQKQKGLLLSVILEIVRRDGVCCIGGRPGLCREQEQLVSCEREEAEGHVYTGSWIGVVLGACGRSLLFVSIFLLKEETRPEAKSVGWQRGVGDLSREKKNEIAQECRRMNGLGNPNAKGLAASGSTLDNDGEFTVRQSARHVFLCVCVPTGAGAKWVKCWNLIRAVVKPNDASVAEKANVHTMKCHD